MKRKSVKILVIIFIVIITTVFFCMNFVKKQDKNKMNIQEKMNFTVDNVIEKTGEYQGKKITLLTNNSFLENVKQEKISNLQKNSISGWSYSLGGAVMPYALYTPLGVDTCDKVPVIVWLHGRDQVFTDKTTFMNKLSNIFTDWVLDGINAYVLCPHLTNKSGGNWAGTWIDVNALGKFSSFMDNFLLEHNNLDINNVVVVGHSMGGQGAIYVSNYTNYFSKLAVLSGYLPTDKPFKEYNIQIPGICYIGTVDDPKSMEHTSNYIAPKFKMKTPFSIVADHEKLPILAFSDDTGNYHNRIWTEIIVVT